MANMPSRNKRGMDDRTLSKCFMSTFILLMNIIEGLLNLSKQKIKENESPSLISYQ